MKASFQKLNNGWNAQPNAPFPSVEVQADDVLLDSGILVWPSNGS
jgi:hypothetical protein